MALLEAKNLGISFGGLRAVDDFNIKIEKGSLYGLIGPNGAGKTTVFNLLTGVYPKFLGPAVRGKLHYCRLWERWIRRIRVKRPSKSIRQELQEPSRIFDCSRICL